jgi:hypothetical protein
MTRSEAVEETRARMQFFLEHPEAQVAELLRMHSVWEQIAIAQEIGGQPAARLLDEGPDLSGEDGHAS